jgi:hypothetical protein
LRTHHVTVLAAYALLAPSPDLPQVKATYHLVAEAITSVVLAL